MTTTLLAILFVVGAALTAMASTGVVAVTPRPRIDHRAANAAILDRLVADSLALVSAAPLPDPRWTPRCRTTLAQLRAIDAIWTHQDAA